VVQDPQVEVGGGDEAARKPGVEPAAGEGQQQVHEHRQVQRTHSGSEQLHRRLLGGVEQATVTVHYPRMARLRDLRALLGPRPGGEVALNGSIPWYVRVHGGTAHTTFDLSRVALYAIELDGGVSQVAVVLPAPSGTVPVRVAGGVHELTVLRPAGVAVRVRVGHGAKDLTLDDQHFGAVGGSTRWQSPGYDQASDRYDVAVYGGADTLTVHTG
jgi:hypothetical protein